MKKKKTKKYEVVLQFESTTWETISIDAVDYQDARKIAEQRAESHISGEDVSLVEFDEMGWECVGIKEVKS